MIFPSFLSHWYSSLRAVHWGPDRFTASSFYSVVEQLGSWKAEIYWKPNDFLLTPSLWDGLQQRVWLVSSLDKLHIQSVLHICGFHIRKIQPTVNQKYLCGSLDGKGVWGKMDICICMSESLCCSPETITTLLIGYVCMHAKSVQSCLTLCDPLNCSPPGSSVNKILQARILEWVAITSSRGSSWCPVQNKKLKNL